MLIENNSKYLLKKTRAKAKMIEYSIPEDAHIEVEKEVEDLFLLTVSVIGNVSAEIVRNPDDIDQIIFDNKSSLEFAAKYFDSYFESKLDEASDDFYLLFGATAYYLCDYIGSSKVLVDRIDVSSIDMNVSRIDKYLVCLLKDCFHTQIISGDNEFIIDCLECLKQDLNTFWEKGQLPELKHITRLRSFIYGNGSDLQLLLNDIFCAIYLLKIHNSAVQLLPKYMQLDSNELSSLLYYKDSLKELWPSQRKLGVEGVFAGKSAVIQMPTSSGKTKSISMIISSAFISNRTRLAVVIAPFRALCREISNDLARDFIYDKTIHVDELSDVFQKEKIPMDTYDSEQKTVLVATPEKFMYMMRQRSDLAKQIGVVVFDEGHLFDEPERGVVYELLMSTIKTFIGDECQKVLVSAIIPNAAQISDWLNKEYGVVISDNTIKSTQKTIAMTDWQGYGTEKYGYLYFLNPEQPDEEEFYVPRVISIIELNKFKKERKRRMFPDVDFKKRKVSYNDIAIYYGLTLCHNGGVGIFCGKKDTANNILSRIIEIEKRGVNICSLIDTADVDEVCKICNLIKENYGGECLYYQAGLKGAFVHRSAISNGIKISLEYAMKKELISFIVCTSTLAQGVNLPIRYLVIASIYQGKERIRVRDFHNLIGRAGRSGIYTEGTVLLTESFVYNGRNIAFSNHQFKWNEYKKLINNNNSEPCSSRILFLIKPCSVGYGMDMFYINMKNVVHSYYRDECDFYQQLSEYKKTHWQYEEQIDENVGYAIKSLGSIESFLMAYLLQDSWEECKEKVKQVASQTLAFHLANEKEKQDIIELFELIGKYCVDNIQQTHQRYICSRSLLSVKKMLHIQKWVEEYREMILECGTTAELYECIFDCLMSLLDNPIILKVKKPNVFLTVGKMWITGCTYADMLNKCLDDKYVIIKRKRPVLFDLDDVIKICDSILSYDISVILSAICEVVGATVDENHNIFNVFRSLSLELKYGVPYGNATFIYEMGFSDRIVSQTIAEFFNTINVKVMSKYECTDVLKYNCEGVKKVIDKYPSVYMDRLNRIVEV